MSHFVSEPSPVELSPATSAQLVPLAPISRWLKLGKDEMYLSESWCGCQLSFDQLPSTLPADQSSLPASQEMLQLETLLIKHKNLIQTQTAGQAFPPGTCRFMPCLLLQRIRARGITHTRGMGAKTACVLRRRCSVLHHVHLEGFADGGVSKGRRYCRGEGMLHTYT